MADEIGVLEHRSDVKDGSESPPSEHLLKLRRGLLGRELFGVNQPRRKNVYVAVPETGRYDEALTVDDGHTARDLDLCNPSNRKDVAAA